MRSSSIFLTAFCLMIMGVSRAVDPLPCCAYNGDGSAEAVGGAVIDINNGMGAQYYSAYFSVDAVSSTMAFIVNNSNAQLAQAGWVITQNNTAQTLRFWYNNDGAGHGRCATVSTALPDRFIPGFLFCPGKEDGAFPTYNAAYALGGLQVNIYTNPPGGSRAPQSGFFLDGSHTCALSSLVSLSAINKEVFSFTAYYGVAGRPNPSAITPPPIC
jgi:hypothetical protein